MPKIGTRGGQPVGPRRGVKKPPSAKKRAARAAGIGSIIFGIRPAPRVGYILTAAFGLFVNTDVHGRVKYGSTLWAERNQWTGVISSNVAAIRYDRENGVLYVMFTSGRIYSYTNMDQSKAELMYNCSSMGKFVHYYLRNAGHGEFRLK